MRSRGSYPDWLFPLLSGVVSLAIYLLLAPPVSGAGDEGTAMLSAFGSLLGGGEGERAALAAALPDPAGTFWRYGWAAGMPARPRRGGG